MDTHTCLTLVWTFHLAFFAIIINCQDEISVTCNGFAPKGCTLNGTMHCGTFLYQIRKVTSDLECQDQCQLYLQCQHWRYRSDKQMCTLFSDSLIGSKNDPNFASGPKYCDGSTPTATPTTTRRTPVDCEWTPFSNWTACSASCGNETQLRYRNIQQQPQFGGALCDGDAVEIRTCNVTINPGHCPSGGWDNLVPENSVCYKMIKVEITWDNATSECQAHGGHLATIANANTQTKLVAAWKEKFGTSIRRAWIGLRWRGDAFEWSDGTPFLYSKWHRGEPNNYGQGEDCVEFLNRPDGSWNDKECYHNLRGYVCQIPKE